MSESTAEKGDWYEIEIGSENGHYVDWSHLLDAPAGKHGFVEVKNGRLFFADGTPARFWGVNIVGSNCFPEKEEADQLAHRLSLMGCNLVRFHHMDAAWANPNIFGNAPVTTALSLEILQKLDYLIAAFKSKGIYIFLDLLVHRQFTSSDGVSDHTPLGAKQVAFFDPVLIRLQQDFISQLFSHTNTVTGVKYCEEPAIIGSEVINESTVFAHMDPEPMAVSYAIQLQELWKQSSYRDKKLTFFDIDWKSQDGTLALKFTGNTIESIKFYGELETGYYQLMAEHIRKNHVRYPIAGSNFPLPILATLRSNATLDFMAVNAYWSHPKLHEIGFNWEKALFAPIHNHSQMLDASLKKNLVGMIARFKVEGKPLIVTEWSAAFPNQYILEAVPLVAAYACLQGWDALCQFDFGLKMPGKAMPTNFTFSGMPDQLAQWVIAAPLFIKGYIKESSCSVVENIEEHRVYNLPSHSPFLDRLHQLPFITKVSKNFSEEKIIKNKPEEFNRNLQQGDMISDTNELVLSRTKHFLKINAPKVQGVVGAIGKQLHELPYLSIEVKNEFASVLVISGDDRDLEDSEVLYLVAVTRSRMEVQEYNKNRDALVKIENGKIMAEKFNGRVTIKCKENVTSVITEALTISGVRINTYDHTPYKHFNIILNDLRSYVLKITLKK